MDISLSGKVAFIGGASEGIGRAVAMELAGMGATIIAAARNEKRLTDLLAELPKAENQNHRLLLVDYAEPAKLKSKLEEMLSKTGSVNILVHNTGGPPSGAAIEAKLEEFANAFTQHLLSGQVLVQALITGMKKEGYGRIINIISTSVKQPIGNLGVSNTIRAAVANWAKTLSLELGQFGITVNNVLPGYTNTGRLKEIVDNRSVVSGNAPEQTMKLMQRTVPLLRFAEPSEIAAGVAFLASPAAAYISGINLPIDGGRTQSL